MPTRRTILGLLGLLPACAHRRLASDVAAAPEPAPGAAPSPAPTSAPVPASLFRPSPLYRGIPAARLTDAESYTPQLPAAGSWPTPFGGPSQNSRSRDPLPQRRWSVGWKVPLGKVENPRRMLVCPNQLIVDGADARGFWDGWGRETGAATAGPGPVFLDTTHQRLLAAEMGGGLAIFVLPAGSRDAALLLPIGAADPEAILHGPGVLVFVTRDGNRPDSPAARRTAVETIRIRDYGQKSRRGIFYGLEPVAGIARDGDTSVRAAAARGGPVLATSEGIAWCDWRLRPLREHRMPCAPTALSVDDQGRACLVFRDHQQEPRFAIIAPDGQVFANHPLPPDIDPSRCRPIVAADGTVFLTPPNHLLAFGGDGQPLWRQTRQADAPGSVSANGQLLVSDDQLYAVSRDGRRRPLWKPPEPIAVAPVVVGTLIYLATERTLYALQGT